MEQAIDDIAFLTRSKTRVQILRELSQDREHTKTDLRQRLNCSRTTVQRNLDSLIDRNLVRRSNQTYSLETGGRYLTENFLQLLDQTEVYHQFYPFLKWVHKDELDIDIRHFQNATLYTPDAGDPYAMINRHIEIIREADSGFGLLSFTGLHATEVAHERVTEAGAQFELVVEKDVANTHCKSPQYAELTDDLAETNGWKEYVYDGKIPLGIHTLDDLVQVIVSDGDEPKAMIESTDKHVYEWARETYEEYKAQATRIL